MKFSTISSAIVGATILISVSTHAALTVSLDTSMGDILIDLRPDVAPGHVQNFLNYVNDGDYDNSFIHRSVNGFIIQGGGFTYIDSTLGSVPTDAPITNEFALSNVRGTIAMAKLGGDPDSGTSQWFINLADNSANLDTQNGGFTVFGTITLGMDVVDAIAALPVFDIDGAQASTFDNVPIRNEPLVDPVAWEDHLVMINTASSVPVPAAAWLFGSALVGLAGIKRKRK